MDAYNLWARNTDFSLFRDKDETKPTWCEVSIPLIEWADELLDRLAQDPHPGEVGYAKWKLFDRYCRLYFRTTSEHRAETNLDNHPCIHQALLEIWQQLEDLELAAAIPELQPPPRPRLVTQPELAQEEIEEVTGILVGEDEVSG